MGEGGGEWGEDGGRGRGEHLKEGGGEWGERERISGRREREGRTSQEGRGEREGRIFQGENISRRARAVAPRKPYTLLR